MHGQASGCNTRHTGIIGGKCNKGSRKHHSRLANLLQPTPTAGGRSKGALCTRSHRKGSMTGPHSTPAKQRSIGRGKHEEGEGWVRAAPRGVHLQHRLQHRRVLQPPSGEKRGERTASNNNHSNSDPTHTARR
jgi:hypothetical protein